MYLVDTNIISAAAPSKRGVPGELVVWLANASHALFLSVVTAAEVEAGIAKALREGATAKAAALLNWWQAIEHLYGERILAMDRETARAAGQILDEARAAKHRPDFADVVIAATARARGLTVLTRNVRHFAPLGVPLLNPFQALPAPPESAR